MTISLVPLDLDDKAWLNWTPFQILSSDYSNKMPTQRIYI